MALLGLGTGASSSSAAPGLFWDGDELKLDGEKTLIASNQNAGLWTINRRTMAGWFLKPGTLWDGCMAKPSTSGEKFMRAKLHSSKDWWTLEEEIKKTEANIRKEMNS